MDEPKVQEPKGGWTVTVLFREKYADRDKDEGESRFSVLVNPWPPVMVLLTSGMPRPAPVSMRRKGTRVIVRKCEKN